MDRFSSLYRRISCAVLLAALCVAGAGSARAQSANAGVITGTVTDPTGAVIPGATVVVSDPKSATTRTTVTNKDGQYVLPDVPPGTYDVKVTKGGFSTDEIPDLTVSVATQSTANFKLAVGSESTVISVEASNADLQTINATTGQTVDNAMVNSLPAIGRDVATFVTMQPGVTPSGYVAGTAQDQGTISLDGGQNSADMDGTQGVYTSNNVGSSTGGFLAGGAGGVMPMPQDSIEEFKVSTSGQTADFNNSTGSSSQVVTKRGHDQLHGSVYEYYLDNSFDANTWQNNFPVGYAGGGYVAKPSYHFSRFGAAAGGPILPKLLGGKTYLFANYEGFRYPAAATYERTVPSYQFLQQGQLTFAGTSALAGCTFDAVAKTNTCSPAQLNAADPRGSATPPGVGTAGFGGTTSFNPTLRNFYNTQLPVAPASNAGSTGANGAQYFGTFDQSCGALSTSYCDGLNTIGYKANILIPQSSNFLATRLDHDFGDKWHFMASYRYYNFQNLTSNQVDIGGVLGSDKMGVPTALTPRPQQPWFLALGMTTNISSSLTNDFHYSYLRNFWQWKGAGAPPQIAGAGGAIEPLGENTTTVLSPFNLNAQNIRTRIWDGKDNYFRDDLTKIKGNHVLQAGFQYQHNFNYHQRTDNGASINDTPTYQIGDAGGGGNVQYTGGLAAVGAGTANFARILDTYYGIVTDTQVANTYTNKGGSLTLNPAATPIGAHTTIPYYNLYATDTWKVTPELTLNYGISYAIEMPPHERDGNQVMWTDPAGNEQSTDKWLENRYTAAANGTVYNPFFAFALLKNVDGGARKYAYNPYYGSVSPRISFAWNPKFESAGLKSIFGSGATVIRGGYGRLYARINGDLQVLNPLLSPGLILATQCKAVAMNNTCSASGVTDATAFRYGTDGISPVLASAAPPTTLPQPYRPGIDGPGVSIASPLDPSLRPSYADTFNLSIQRQIGHRQLLEVGYIGRYINHDYIMKNPNQVPYNLALNGQSFAQAYAAVETAMGCTLTASACKATTTAATAKVPVYPVVSAQPFFEKALNGGSISASTASAAGSYTQALVNSQVSKFGAQQVFALWQALDNGIFNSTTVPRSLAGTATGNTTYGSAGQTVTGISIGTADGWANYHGGYVSYKISSFHGLTLQENLTWSKALGLGTYNQSTSSITAQDSYNLANQYGRQSFDQKVIFNTFVVYQTPWYKGQNGIIGRLAGGWTFSPVVAAGTGQPLVCTTNNSGQNFGGEDGSTFTDSETCIFTKKMPGTEHTYRGVTGSTAGTAVKGPGSAAVNMFSNPDAVYANVRAPILGYDTKDSLSSTVSGLGYLNLDLSIKKEMRIWEKYSLEFSGVLFNAMNHLDFANPSLNLQSVTAFGVTKTQGNTPRQIQMGVRANF